MQKKSLLRTGIIGSIFTGLCCFTPLLVITLSTLGLSSALVWLDYVLLPALLIFLIIIGYALWQKAYAI